LYGDTTVEYTKSSAVLRTACVPRLCLVSILVLLDGNKNYPADCVCYVKIYML